MTNSSDKDQEKALANQHWTSILARISERDAEAFSLFFDHFSPRVKAFCLAKQPGANLLAEELVQEVMIKVWDKSHLFNPKLASVTTWLFTLTRNCQIDHFRRNKNHLYQNLEADDLWYEYDTAPDPFLAIQQHKSDLNVHQSLKELPREQHDVLEKVYIQGRTQQQAAEELGVPLGTVKSRVRLAVAKLEKMLRS
ncbi:sigma-70 family RNA polymerase sigma factor [Aurantivibrio plasticivorans]